MIIQGTSEIQFGFLEVPCNLCLTDYKITKMAKTSGKIRTTGGFITRDSSYKGNISNIRSLNTVKDAQVYKELKQGISRYHSALGVRQRNVKIGDLTSQTIGVHITSDGKSEMVVLNGKVFNKSKKDIEKRLNDAYKSGFLTVTNKPVQHAVTHELAHASWNKNLAGAKHKAAGKEIYSLYDKWDKDKKKKGYGEYATKNVNEFWAETVTKAIHGNSDKYTRKVKYIARKYKL